MYLFGSRIVDFCVDSDDELMNQTQQIDFKAHQITPEFIISTQQQNGGQVEDFPGSTNHLDKYSLRQYLVATPDRELKSILDFTRHQKLSLRNPELMDQRSIVIYLNRKGVRTQVIHDELVATLGEEATAYSKVTNYVWVARIIPRDESWLYYITDHGFIWLSPDGKVPDRERVTIQSKSHAHYRVRCEQNADTVV
jgi:hypothetical protein